MIYPDNFESKIGFQKIRELLLEFCVSDMGKKWVSKLKFSSHYRSISTWLEQTEEMKSILLGAATFPTLDYFDLRPDLFSIKQKGTYLSREVVFDLFLSLRTMKSIDKLLISRGDDNPELIKLLDPMKIVEFVLPFVHRIMDDFGEIKDNASSELFEIRQQLKTLEINNGKIINEKLNLAIKEGWASINTEAAIRNGRVVIPLHAAYKRKIKGFVHGESATGQTVFVEPAQLFEINNEIQELEAAEKRAIIKILQDLADVLRPEISALQAAYDSLSLIDFIVAKARLAIELQAIKPDFLDQTLVDWHGARHPLLYLSHKAQNKSIIPLDVQLYDNQRILIISGPNAGGKSVALKTIGLLQYMIQCGLLIPLKPTSRVGIFKHFFIDIGDEQSIENDLSTYSSHLLNMKFFLQKANIKTLFLIDEFGGGTEPNLGGSIAETILEELHQKGAFGVITTHFANLKLLPSPNNNMVNGAMLFNTKDLEPLFELKIGRPGSSFTVEIAKKIGFTAQILRKIEQKADRRQLDFEEQLQQLDVEKKEIAQKKREIEASDAILTETLNKYQYLYDHLDGKKNKILKDAEKKAQEIINNSNQLIEQTIRDIKEAQADQQKTRGIRQKLEKEKELLLKSESEKTVHVIHKEVRKDLKPKEKPKAEKSKAIVVGQPVLIKGQKNVGILEEIKGKKSMVSFGNMSMSIALSRLEGISKARARELQRKQSSNYSKMATDFSERAASFNIKLDVRGLRVDEAIDTIQRYIDDAILLRIFEVQILHGKGTGALRQTIRDYLSGIPEIESYKDEHIERGGHGITLVNFGM